jgi:hypothetical protein
MNKIIAPIIFAESSLAVSDLQAALNILGFGQIKADEINKSFFGETTCKALTTFKEKFKIEVFPCLVESQTADIINQRLDRLFNPAVSGPPQIKIKSPLIFGMKSQAVLDLQTALRTIGFGAGIKVAENTIFDKTTCEAVISFQREMGIEVVACYVDNETADKINSLMADLPNNNEKYKVSGFVFDSNNKFVDQQAVVAYDIDLLGSGAYKKATSIAELTAKGGVQLLGNGVSNVDGFYSIEFTRPGF